MTRNYQMMSAGLGSVALGTVAALDSRSAQLQSRDYPIQICLTGTTAQRPRASDGDLPTPAGQLQAGIHYLDTSLGYIVISDGQGNWRNPSSGSVV